MPPSPDVGRPNSPATGAAPHTRCLCATVRRAARLLTRRYEEALRPAGVTVSQFELLMTLRAAGPVDQRTLARLLETDQTTLSRNLKLLLSQRWIATAAAPEDARRRLYRVAPLGLPVLRVAERCWHAAHEQMERQLGQPITTVLPQLDRILDAARHPTEPA